MSEFRTVWSWFTWVTTAITLILCFRGEFPPNWTLLGFVVPWGLRLLCSSASRERFVEVARRYWKTCTDYPHAQASLPWRAAALFVVLPTGLLFLANDHIDEGDNVPVMLAATSLASEGNWELSEFLNRPREFPYLCGLQSIGNRVYSGYPAGPVQFAFPVVLASKFLGGNYQKFSVQRRLHKWTAAWVSAVCLGLFFLTALHLVDAASALVSTMLFATGSAMYTTIGQGLWQHGGILLWSQLVVLLEFRSAVRPARGIVWLQGFSLGFMMACRLSGAILLLPLVAWVVLRDWRRGTLLAILSGAFYLPWAALYLSIYGQPFGPSSGQLSRFCWEWGAFLTALEGTLFSPARGFFVYQVWGFLIFGAFVGMVFDEPRSERGTQPKGWRWVCSTIFVLNVLMVSAWNMWWGGWCWGSRLVSDSLLLFALLCVEPVSRLLRHSAGRALLLAMFAVGLLVNLPVIYWNAGKWNENPNVDQAPERLWSWEDPPFLYAFASDQPKR